MLNLKRLSQISLVVLLTLTVFTPKLHAEDDMVVSDEETLLPPSSSTTTPPVMIDESDSGSVNDVEEYDG